MASRPALDEWLDAADELLDGPVLVGRRLGVVRQERGRQLELRYGALLGTTYVQLTNVDPTSGETGESLLLRADSVDELVHHLTGLVSFLDGTTR